MTGRSAGILMFRKKDLPEVLLVHPGGPFWAKKDLGTWSVPKGEYTAEEDALAAAMREFREETGVEVNSEEFIPLAPIVQKAGKEVIVWAVEGDLNVAQIKSNFFEMEWPPKSGKKQSFPEIDRGAWFGFEEARSKINEKQVALIDQLERILSDK